MRGGALVLVAYIVAGTVRTHYEGDPEGQQLLKDRLYEPHVETGC